MKNSGTRIDKMMSIEAVWIVNRNEKFLSTQNCSRIQTLHHLNLHLTPLLLKVKRTVVAVVRLKQINQVRQSYKSKPLASLINIISIAKSELKNASYHTIAILMLMRIAILKIKKNKLSLSKSILVESIIEVKNNRSIEVAKISKCGEIPTLQ